MVNNVSLTSASLIITNSINIFVNTINCITIIITTYINNIAKRQHMH